MRLIISLVVIDMTVKTVIYLFFMNTKLYFLSDKFGLVPLINREQLSFFNLELGIEVNITILIVINAFLLAALCFLQFRLYKIGLMNTHMHVILSLFIAGSICSIFDKLVFGGSLDYLLVYRWICDLKDIYLFAALAYMVTFLVMIDSSSSQDVKVIKAIFGFDK